MKSTFDIDLAVQGGVEDTGLISQRREQLVISAIELFSKDGYHSSTVKDLARVAGVSAGLIYQYVRDKQDLLFLALRYIVERNLKEIPAAMEGVTDPLDRLMRAFGAYLRTFDANRHASVLTYRETKSLKPEHREDLKKMELLTNQFLVDCISGCIERRYFRPVNAELLTYSMILMAHGWALKHWRLRNIYDIDAYGREVLDLLLQSVLTAKGRKKYAELLLATQSAHPVAAKSVRRASNGKLRSV